MSSVTDRLSAAVSQFDPTAMSVQVGRAVIALAQLSVLTLTPWERLTPQILGQPQAPFCQGLGRISLFCMVPPTHVIWALVASSIVLLLVIAGILPRYVGLAHVWVSFSIALSLGLADGGEQVAQVCTVLLAVVVLADGRLCAWIPQQRDLKPVLRGVAFAAWWMLRLQLVGIYAQSGLAKLGVEDWLNGSAMYYIVRDPSFGASGPVGYVMREVTSLPVGVAALTWGSIVLELLIAVLLLRGPRHRGIALAMSVALHVSILVSIGLWSFALIMIGAMIIAAGVWPRARIGPISEGSSEQVDLEPTDVRRSTLPSLLPAVS